MSHDHHPIMRLAGVYKRFGDFTALHSVDLDVHEGEFLTIVGPSGSGNTTLIRLMVGMDEPTDGTIWLRSTRIDQVPANKRPTCMVFQSLALFPHRSVGQNIEFPLKIRGVNQGDRKTRALELLTALDVQHRAEAMPSQLSGGEQQRVSIARGLVNRPPVILADEPTAPLDSERAMAVVRILNDMARKLETAIIVVTHDEKIIPTFKRIYHIRDGVTHEEVGEGRSF